MPRLGSAPVTVLGAVAIIVLGVLGAALWLWHERAQTLEEGDRLAGTFAHVLQEQTARTVQAVDLTLMGIVEVLHLSPELAEHDPSFQEALLRRLDALPYIRALFVIGPDGFITQDSDHPLTPRVSLADRDYFQAHLQDPNLGLHIGPPLRSRSVGTWFVSMSRPLRSPDGSFAGIAVAAVEPIYFASFYEDLGLGAQDSIALLSRDGTVIVRHPHREELMGRTLPESELFRRLSSGMLSGSYRSASPVDGVRRIVSFRALENVPLVVTVGLAEKALLAPWRRKLVETGVATALLAALVAFVAGLVVHYRRHEEQIQSQIMQAQRLEALGRLTGGLAHDFNNLLAVMSGALRLIESRRSSDPRIAEFAGMAKDAVTRGTRLIAQLLAFSRQQQLDLRPANLNLLIRDLEPLLKSAMGSAASLELDLAPDLGWCRVDATQFDSALLNLAINAKDAMPRGGVVRIATANGFSNSSQWGDLPSRSWVRASVVDSGEGMPPEVAQRALEPFFTTKGEAGTGLGLSQVYGFVHQVGGDLRIESRPGAGTAVHLLFPKVTQSIANGDVEHPPSPRDRAGEEQRAL
jgi:signal transduction histidine kinase